MRRRPAAPAALLGAGAALLLLPGLGSLDLWAPDEPRYAQVAEELRAGEAGWRGALLLHLGGDVYDQKPPLYFWLAALAGWPEGRVGERAARLPSALAGLGCVALTARLGARLLGPASGTLGAALLLTTGEFARLARRAQLDVLLTFFVLATFAAFVRIEERPGLPRPRDLVFLHGALGLAALVKGPVGLLIPVLAMVGFALWEGRAARLARLARPALLALSLGPALAWLAACAWLAPAGYLAGAVGENLFGRFFLGSSHARPAWYYLEQLPAGFLPWTLLWPVAACFGARRALAPGAEPGRARAWRLLVAWAGTGLLFFSASAGKRGLYLLPLYPAGALLCADAAIGLLAGRRREPPWARAVFAVLLLAVLGAAAALPALARRFGLEAPPALAPGLAALGLAAGAARRIVGSRQTSAWPSPWSSPGPWSCRSSSSGFRFSSRRSRPGPWPPPLRRWPRPASPSGSRAGASSAPCSTTGTAPCGPCPTPMPSTASCPRAGAWWWFPPTAWSWSRAAVRYGSTRAFAAAAGRCSW